MISFFSQGLCLEQRKGSALEGAIVRVSGGKSLLVPLPGAEAAAERTVRPGDSVQRFEKLTEPPVGVPVSAPVSGRIAEIRTVAHPLEGPLCCAVLEADGRHGAEKKKGKDSPGPDEILEIARQAGIIDEFDGIPLYKKLRRIRREKTELIWLNAVDDEPYVSSALAVLKESGEDALEGLKLAACACGSKEYAAAVPPLREIRRFPAVLKQEKIFRWTGREYPGMVWLQSRLEREGRSSASLGIQCCLALKQAVQNGTPQISTVITVAGEGVDARNLRVPLGTTVRSVLSFCGLRPEGMVVMGSPLTGARVDNPDVPIVQGTRCLLLLPEKKRQEPCDCIACGRCVEACPRGILPWYLHRQLRRGGEIFPGAERCCGCNACSAVCPSGLPLGDAVRRAAELKEGGGER